MSLLKPYKRTIRQFTAESIYQGRSWEFITHKDYAECPEHYVRAFEIILKDFINLLDYIEPADKNLDTYSFRIHELLLRTCIEIEANFVAILKENGYSKTGDWSMTDYKKVNLTHRLSEYEVKLPIWKGVNNIRTPFDAWKAGSGLSWWIAYNKTKHNRHKEFEMATFQNLTNAICALIAVLTSQFGNYSFSPTVINVLSVGGGPNDGMSPTIGDYFRVKYPESWDDADKYGFFWSDIKNNENPIAMYNY